MRKALALGTIVAALAAGVASANPGDTDPNFGVKPIDFGGTDTIGDVAVQPNGNIVVAGASVTGAPAVSRYAVRRFTPAGAIDPFGNLFNVGTGDQGNALALQHDGKVVVVGWSLGGSAGTDSGVLRLLPNGTRDPDFDGDGGAIVNWGGNSEILDVAVQPDGRIVLAGWSAGTMTVGRLLENGARDTTFGTSAPGSLVGVGTTVVPVTGTNSRATAVALQPDGKIVVAGWTNVNTNDMVIARLNANGTMDASFSGDGIQTLNLGGSEGAQAVVVQPDGRIVVAGFGTPNIDFVAARFQANGLIDSSFGNAGTATVDFDAFDAANALALQANGKLVLAGQVGLTVGVTRLQPGGALDTTFGTGGKATRQLANPAFARGIALQPDGGIVIAGDNSGNGFVTRLEGDPVAAGGGPPGGGGGGGAKSKVPRCAGKRATIVGSARKDKLRGTRKADVIVGLGGNDSISGGGGNDVICAGAGNDKATGGAGNDKVYGESGKDSLSGDAGNDGLSGGDGNDKLSGAAGNDKLSGGDGNDKLSGAAGNDKLSGGGGTDTLSGDAGKDALSGGGGRDACTGGGGRDRATCEQRRSV